MKISELLAKVKSGEELTEEETKEVEAIDAAAEAAEEGEVTKTIEDAFTKFLGDLDARYAPKVIETKDVEKEKKEKLEKMSDEETKGMFFKALVTKDDATLKFLQTGVPADGGYLVPAAVNNEVLNFLKTDSVMRANAYVKMNCPQSYPVNQFASLPTATFRDEAGLKPKSKPTFSQQTLTPYSVSVLCVLTNEIKKYAGIDIANEVIDSMKEALVVKEEEVFASGNGTGMPTGLETYYAAYPAARKITASAFSSLVDRISTADTKLNIRYKRNAKWYMTSDQLGVIRRLKDLDGRPIYQPDVTGEFAGTICGKPVLINESLTNIWYGDLKGYWIGQAEGGISVAMSEDATITSGESTINLFEKNMFALRVEEEIDGELVNNRALIAIEAGADES